MFNWLSSKFKPQPKGLPLDLILSSTKDDPPIQRLRTLLSTFQKTKYQIDRRELMIQRVGLIENSYTLLINELMWVNSMLRSIDGNVNSLRLHFDDVISSESQPLSLVLGDNPSLTMRDFVEYATTFTILISDINIGETYPRIESMINKNIAVLEEATLVLLRCVR